MNPILKLAYNTRQFVKNLFSTRATKEGTAYLSDPGAWLEQFFTGTPTWSGAKVNENTSLEYVPYWTCVKVLRETIASLPIILYERTENGKERAVNHSAYKVLHLKANPEQTAYDYKEMIASHFLIYGNSYSEKIYNNAGQLVELWPLMPWNMEVKRIAGKRWYFYELPNQEKHTFREDEILHLSNFTLTGLEGARVNDFIKQSLGSGIAADEYGARFFANDAAPGGIIEMPGNLGTKKENLERFKASWEKNYGNMTNKHRTAILEDGAKFHELTITPEKAQFLETRKFQEQQTAAFHRIPPHLIGNLEHATYTNIEHQSLEFINYTMLPYFTRFEQNFTTQCLTEPEQETFFYEFLVDAITRGDIKTRYEAYRTGREIGVLSVNDVREKENMNKIEDGDVRHVPLNWTILTSEIVATPDVTSQDEPDDNNENQEDNQEENSQRELRALKRSANTRRTIAISYEIIYRDILDRLIKKERSDIKKGFKKYYFERDKEEFDKWYKEYYQTQTEYIKKRLSPVYFSLNNAIYKEVLQEIDGIEKKEDQERFVINYIEVYVRKYILEHKKNIGLALMDIKKNGADPEERMNEIFDSWDRNSKNDSHDETVKSSNAFAKSGYILAGLQFLRWVNTGGSPCPYCQQMDGKIVGINQSFIQNGNSLDSDNGSLNINHDVGHAPLHNGCECQIMGG